MGLFSRRKRDQTEQLLQAVAQPPGPFREITFEGYDPVVEVTARAFRHEDGGANVFVMSPPAAALSGQLDAIATLVLTQHQKALGEPLWFPHADLPEALELIEPWTVTAWGGNG